MEFNDTDQNNHQLEERPMKSMAAFMDEQEEEDDQKDNNQRRAS